MSWTSHTHRGGGHRGSCSTRIGEAEARERCKVGRGFPPGGQKFVWSKIWMWPKKVIGMGDFWRFLVKFLESQFAKVIFWTSVRWTFPLYWIIKWSQGPRCAPAKRQEFVLVIKVTQILEEKKQALAAKQKTREAQPEPDLLVGMCPIAQVISLFLLGNLVSFFDPDSLHKSNKRNLLCKICCHLASNLNRKNVLSWRRGLRPTRRTAWYHTTLCTCSVHVGSEVMASLFIIPHEVFHSSHGCKEEKRLCWCFGILALFCCWEILGEWIGNQATAKPTLGDLLPQEYADSAAELVKLRREAKVNGNFFVEPEARPGLNGWGIPTLTQRLEPPKTWVAFWVDVFFLFWKGKIRFRKVARRSCCLWCELRASSRWAPNPGPFWPLEHSQRVGNMAWLQR